MGCGKIVDGSASGMYCIMYIIKLKWFEFQSHILSVCKSNHRRGVYLVKQPAEKESAAVEL